jgi:uncharacterized protein (DUF2062 family)
VRAFIRRRLLAQTLRLLRQGLTPDRLALTLALGAALGVFPVLGSTMLLCTIAAMLLRLNIPAIQLANYAVYPLQILLLIPLMKLGSVLFGDGSVQLTAGAVLTAIREDVWLAVGKLWGATLHAIGAWFVVTPLPVAALYLLLRVVLRRVASSLDGPVPRQDEGTV